MEPRVRVTHVREEDARAIVQHGEMRGTCSVRYRLADDLEASLVIQYTKDKGLALDMSVGVDDVGLGPKRVSRLPDAALGLRMTRQPARMRTRLELAGLGKGECLRVELDRMDVIVVRPEEDEVFARGRSHCIVCTGGAGLHLCVR